MRDCQVTVGPLKIACIAIGLVSLVTACGLMPGTPAAPSYEGEPLPAERGDLFAGSGACASCHTNLTDEAGNDVSNETEWRASMMANAARDPYWQASVRLQVVDYPHLQATIEEKCATCHTPMAHFAAITAGEESPLLDRGFLDEDHPRHTLAVDGVSCTLCHQVQPDKLGTPDSFSGGFSIDTERPRGERWIYGPFPPVEEPARVMQDASGYRPVEGQHTGRSELCATCHTLYTPYVDSEGQIAGTFPEQVPYLEWQHSDYQTTHACQDCHMPPAEGAVPLANTGGGPPRSPFARHLFIGGNAYVLRVLRLFGEEIGVTASPTHFQRKIDQTLDQLQRRTATLGVDGTQLPEDVLELTVTVTNLAGHKVPTGFPSRRAWLHVTVRDSHGELVFESGAVNDDGSIAGDDRDADPGAYEPHYESIDSRDQVQIYESTLTDIDGKITTSLLAAMGYLKDNRLLPSGFEKTAAGADFAVYGGALKDPDFLGGSDTVRYAVPLDGAAGPFDVSVQLLYQSIGHYWAESLRGYDEAEPSRFLSYYDSVKNDPVVVAERSITLEP